jgi:hypothetical protein
MANLGAAKAFEPETINALTLANTQTAADIKILNTFIRTLKLNGAWRHLDALWVMCLADTSISYLNLKNPGTFTLSPQSSPTFSAYQGVTFDGASNYMDTGLTPSTAAAATMQAGSPCNMMIGVWELTEVAVNGARAIGVNINSAGNLYLVPRAGSGNQAQFGINTASTNIGAGSVTSSIGLWALQRESDDTVSLYRNGASLATSATAQGGTGLPSKSIYIGALNSNGTAANFRGSRIGMAFCGARMNAVRHLMFYNAAQTALHALGAV